MDKELEYIYLISESNNENALQLIDSIEFSIDQFTEEQYNKFILYKNIVNHKNYIDIFNDTLIFNTVNYFTQKNDYLHTALSLMYSGKVFELNGDLDNALVNYLRAEVDFASTNSTRNKALIRYYIANIYSEQKIYTNAVSRYKEAINYFDEINDLHSKVYINYNIGSCFVKQSMLDSAMYYYKNCDNLLKKVKDKDLQHNIEMNIAILYQLTDNFDKAQSYYNRSLVFATDTADSISIYVYLSDLYMTNQLYDSAKINIEKAMSILSEQEDLDELLKVELIKMKSNNAEISKDYQNALNYYKLYSEKVIDIISTSKSSDLLEIEKKYATERFEKLRKVETIEKQRILLVSIFSFLLASIVIWVLYRYVRKQKRESVLAEQKIEDFKEIKRKYKIECSCHSKYTETAAYVMNNYFNILTKAALIERHLKDEEITSGRKLLRNFNLIVYGKDSFNWDDFYLTINGLNNNIFKKISIKYPQLDESEFKICCLAYCGLSNLEICMILDANENTIKTKRYWMRRKMNITGYSNFVEELNRIFYNND